MKDNLKDFIEANRDAFDSEPAPDKVWESLASEFDKPSKSRVIPLADWRWLSAAALLVLSIGAVLYLVTQKKQVAPTGAVAEEKPAIELPQQLQDLDAMYKVHRVSTLKALEKFPEERQDIQEELSELDIEFEQLRSDLGEGFSNEAVLEAMIENYRVKLEVLESTLEHVKRHNNHYNTLENETIL